MITFERKFVSKPGFELQISSSPYWRLNQLGHCDTRKQTSLSHFKFQSKTLMNVTCYFSLESNPQVGINFVTPCMPANSLPSTLFEH